MGEQHEARAGREAEFTAWARDAWGALVRSAVFLGCDLHEAQDVAQTTLVKAYAAWPRVAAADDRTAYVYRMLVNALRDARRRRSASERPAEHLPVDRSGGTPDAADGGATADAVHRAMAGLSPLNRQVVVLRYFAGLTERQTAEALDVPPGTVKSRLSRALAHLAADDHLDDLRPGSPELTGDHR
ncbi:MAG: SigE family RNA polymerase sigma factor [Nocardioides sp.]|nr:SigE family RNA polymerase sigma factor [Nocardioides sp.]